MATYTTAAGKRATYKEASSTNNTYVINDDTKGATIAGAVNGDIIAIEGFATDFTASVSGRVITLKSTVDTGIVIKVQLANVTGATASFRFLDGDLTATKGAKITLGTQTLTSKAAAIAETNTLGSNDSSATFDESSGGSSSTGSTFTLTTDANDIAGTSANETIKGAFGAAADNTLSAGDNIDGGDGVDTLNLTVIGDADSAAAVILNVETINIRDVIGADDFNAILIEDAPTINFTNTIAGNTSTVINAGVDSTYGLAGAGNMTVDYIGNGGTSDTAKVALNGAGTDDANSTVTVADGNATEAVTITTSGNNFATVAAGTGAETVTISGSGTNELTITGAAAIAINASASTGTNTLVMANTLSSTDTITGGTGADTVTATIAAATTVRPTASAVETYELGFTAAGTFDARNVTGVKNIEIANQTANATITRLASTATTLSITEETATTTDLAIGYATNSNTAVTLTIGATDDTAADQVVNFGDVTLTANEGALTIVSAGEDANLVDAVAANDVSALTIDARTQGLTTTTVSATSATAIDLKATAGSLVTGAITATDAEDITLRLTTGDLTTGLITSAADVDVSITATSDAGDDVTTSLDVDALKNLTVSASAGSDVTITEITLTGENTDGDDINVDFNLTSAVDSTVTITEISAAAAAEIDSIVMTGAGDFSITSTDADVNIQEIDGASVTGDITLDFDTAVNNTLTIETGSGDDTISGGSAADTINAGSGDDSITGGAGADDITVGAGEDTIVLTTEVTADTVQDFNADDDSIEVTVGDIGSELVNGNGDALVADATVTIQSQLSTAVTDIAVGTQILSFTDDLANAAAMLDALDALSFAAAGTPTDDDDILVLWTDGSDTFLSSVNVLITGDAIDDATATASTLVTLVGVAIDDVAAANFAFV